MPGKFRYSRKKHYLCIRIKSYVENMRNIVILNSPAFSYPLPVLMRVEYNSLIVKQDTSNYHKDSKKYTQCNACRELFRLIFTHYYNI